MSAKDKGLNLVNMEPYFPSRGRYQNQFPFKAISTMDNKIMPSVFRRIFLLLPYGKRKYHFVLLSIIKFHSLVISNFIKIS